MSVSLAERFGTPKPVIAMLRLPIALLNSGAMLSKNATSSAPIAVR